MGINVSNWSFSVIVLACFLFTSLCIIAQIKLETLQARRRRGDIIETFKNLHGFENVDPTKFFNKAGSQHPHRTRLTSALSSETVETPSCRLVKKKHNLALRGNLFSQPSVVL